MIFVIHFFLFFRLNTDYYTTLSVAEDKDKIKRAMFYSMKGNLCLLLKSQVILLTVTSGSNCK